MIYFCLFGRLFEAACRADKLSCFIITHENFCNQGRKRGFWYECFASFCNLRKFKPMENIIKVYLVKASQMVAGIEFCPTIRACHEKTGLVIWHAYNNCGICNSSHFCKCPLVSTVRKVLQYLQSRYNIKGLIRKW